VLAQSESLAYAKMAQEQLTKMQEASKQKKENHRKKMEELNTPLPPLDGNDLGRALLKNLGLDTPNRDRQFDPRMPGPTKIARPTSSPLLSSPRHFDS
jgi:hypothetical protein